MESILEPVMGEGKALRGKRKVTFRYQGRTRRLLKRNGGSGDWYLRFKIGARQIWRALETDIDAPAIAKAKKIIDAELDGGKVQEARELKARPGWALLSDICEIFVRNFGTSKRRHMSARNYVGALRKMVQLGAPGVAWEAARADVLTSALIRKFEAALVATIKRDKHGFMDHADELRTRTSVQSWVLQARAIFKRSTMSWYEGHAFPDLTEFRDQGVTTPRRGAPERLDEGVIKSLIDAAPALANEDPAVYIAFLLFSRLGLRNSEQLNARMSWIRRDPKSGKAYLEIKDRPAENVRIKGKEKRTLTIGAELMAEIEKHWTKSPDGDFLVPGSTKTDRFNAIYYRHSAWCGQWIKDRSKTSYELRRYAGSIVYKKSRQLYVVQKFLGHSKVSTTQEWYLDLLEEMPVVDLGDFEL